MVVGNPALMIKLLLPQRFNKYLFKGQAPSKKKKKKKIGKSRLSPSFPF